MAALLQGFTGGGLSAPAAPQEVKGGGIETPLKSNDPAALLALKKKKQQDSVTLLGEGGERKVGL